MSMPIKNTDGLDAIASGPIRDLQQVRSGTTASLAELKLFLDQLKGRRPQEVIGIVSSSLLFQSLIIAFVVVIAILFIFTVVPYVIYGPPLPKQPAPNKSIATAESESGTSPNSLPTDAPQASPTQANPTQQDAVATQPSNSVPDAAKASKVMGLDEVKPADPTVNPLDNPSLDKLLDGI